MYQFLPTDSVTYVTRVRLDSINDMMDDSDEEMERIDQMFIFSAHSEGGYTVSGFSCDKLIMNSPNGASQQAILYLAPDIPHSAESLGPFSKYFTGAPVQTEMNMGGLRLTLGVIEYTQQPSMLKYLEFRPADYVELSLEEFQMKKLGM